MNGAGPRNLTIAGGSTILRLEVQVQVTAEDRFEACIRQGLRLQHRRFDRPLAQFVVRAARVDLHIDHAAARHLRGCATGNAGRAVPNPVVTSCAGSLPATPPGNAPASLRRHRCCRAARWRSRRPAPRLAALRACASAICLSFCSAQLGLGARAFRARPGSSSACCRAAAARGAVSARLLPGAGARSGRSVPGGALLPVRVRGVSAETALRSTASCSRVSGSGTGACACCCCGTGASCGTGSGMGCGGGVGFLDRLRPTGCGRSRSARCMRADSAFASTSSASIGEPAG